MKRRIIGLFGIFVPLAFGAPANATLVNLDVEGTVQEATQSNPFGLMVGDTVSANAMFDNDLIAAVGESEVEFGNDGNAFGSMLTFIIGDVVLEEFNDAGFLNSIFPLLLFNDGAFTGFEFVSEAGINGATVFFSASDETFLGFDDEEGIFGIWDLENASITPKGVAPISLPAAFWLFGSALLGMIGFRQRNQHTTALQFN